MAFRRTLSGSVFSSTTSTSEDSTSVVSSNAFATTSYEITDRGNSTMKVVVRIRPENDMEIRSNYQPVVKALDEHVLVFDPSPDNEPKFRATGDSTYQKRRPVLGKKHKDLRFAFDHVFDETASQSDVFKRTTESIVEGVLDGINCSVFAYGATGAGKTYTMLGNIENPGVMFLTMMELYRRIDELKDDKICEVAVSYCEVYNETIRDLLVPSAPLHLREDGQKGLVVAGLSRHTPKTANEILNMLEIGNQNRTQHPTDANATSSRSHAVFQVFVHQKARTAGLSAQVTTAKMSLIDLAGSERATVTTNRGARLREGANINKSLLALGNCINALADNKGKSVHVPYRNSKLTRLLKDSLGGNCRTVMIANVSPSGLSYEDTYNTLKYADRAKQIKTKLVRNVLSVDFHVTKYKTIVFELRREVAELKAKLDKKTSLPTRETYDESEANRLQGLVKNVYSERCRLRKQMAELDTSEREALLKVSRKERDIQRIDTISANETKKAKISSRIEHLRKHVEEVRSQKETLNEKLCANNESIGRVQAEINTACCDTNKPGVQALRQLMDVVVEAKKLEVENAHQWRLTKLLLKFIKNQEREVTKTEKLLVFSLSLILRQHTVIRASQVLTPSLQDSYETLVRLAEGEKGVAWADQSNVSCDGLMDVSTSNFTQSQNAIFDNLLAGVSPRTRRSDGGGTSGSCDSPFLISTSLGILASKLDSNNVTTTPYAANHTKAAAFSTPPTRGVSSMMTPKSFKLESDSIPRPNSLIRRGRLDQKENEYPNTDSDFGSSPFVHRTTVSAGGVKCETKIGGMRAVSFASSGQSNLMNQLSHSASKLQISTSAKLSNGITDDTATPVRMSAMTKTSHSGSKFQSNYRLENVESVMAGSTTSNSHYDKFCSDSSSQGSTSLYSTQCVVTNQHDHISDCNSMRKNSDPQFHSNSPHVDSYSFSQQARPKSANEILTPRSRSAQKEIDSGRLTAFTPIRGTASDIKSSNPQTPSLPSNSVGGASTSHDHAALPLVSPGVTKQQQQHSSVVDRVPVCTRTDSGYSTNLSQVSRNGHEAASPYLVPFSGAGPKYTSNSHSTSSGTRQPAFQLPSLDMSNVSSSNSQGSRSFTSFSSHLPQLNLINNHLSLSQQSQTPSTGSDNSTGCVVDMNMSTRPRPAFQTFQNKLPSSFSSSSNFVNKSSPMVAMTSQGITPLKEVRSAILSSRSFCSFEDNFVSPQSFGVAKMPVGVTTASPSTSTTTPALNQNFSSHCGPMNSRQFPPTASVSSRNNYLSNSYHGSLHSTTQSPATNNYSRSPSHKVANPYSTSASTDLTRGGARSAPHMLSGRYRSALPPQSPGTYAKSFPPGAPGPSTAPSTMQPLSSSPQYDSQSDSTDVGSHIYQTIEPPPPPLPPPRTRNIYVPRPQTMPSGSHAHTSSTGRVQNFYKNDMVASGYTGRSGLYESRGRSAHEVKRSPQSNANALNETFTIEPSNQMRPLPYQPHQLRPTSAPNGDRGSSKTNAYVQHPPSFSSSPQAVSSVTRHNQHAQEVEKKVPSYLQMTKSAASKRVPKESKLLSTAHPPPPAPVNNSSSHHTRSRPQDKENKGRSIATKPHSIKTTLTSSSSKWNRRLPSTSSNGSSSTFIKSVKFHHGNGMPIAGSGLLRSREPTTATA